VGKISHGGNNGIALHSTVSDSEVTSVLTENDGEAIPTTTNGADLPNTYIIQWRGEGTEGYSEPLRQLEFTSAFRAEMKDYLLFNDREDEDFATSWPDEMEQYSKDIQFNFQDALTYQGPTYEDEESDPEFEGVEPIPFAQVQAYESGMQYVAIILPLGVELESSSSSSSNTIPTMLDQNTLGEIFQNTIQRCSLIRTAFQIVAEGASYEELATVALDNGSFLDIMEGGTNVNATWSIRLRRYGPMEEVGSTGTNDDDSKSNTNTKKKSKRQARYGKNVRSPLRDERKAIFAMEGLVQFFLGRVDLADPECRIYLLEGLKNCDIMLDRSDGTGGNGGDVEKGKKLLARVVAKGPKTSIYRPNTRICITTTPLCPIASFTLCNIAQLQRHGAPAILDPFAGSCATLLAAAHITSPSTTASSQLLSKPQSNNGGCRSVAIEIAHNGYVNKDDIIQDFVTRSLPPPSEIITGSCLSAEVRHQARSAIGGGAFDAIVTDPPYGIREAMSSEEESEEDSPLTQLFYAMGQDRSNGTSLLKLGGRLVAFIPVREGESLEECLPDSNARKEAGLVMEGEGKEQVLSDILSRWLVSFVCV